MANYANYERAYAHLVITSGIALYPGQSVMIKTEYENYPFARLLAQTAYQEGAQEVQISVDDYRLIRSKIENQTDEQLTTFSDFSRQIDYEMMAKDWAYIRIDNTEDPHALKGVDYRKLTLYRRAMSNYLALMRDSRMRHEHPWCVICAPGPVWAQTVLGENSTTADLWDLLIPILRLDKDDPAQAWRDHSQFLQERCSKLNTLAIKELHFTATGTDLHIGFRDEHRWFGGGDPLPDGRWFLPNIPTEEVFTVPDLATAHGYVHTTRPVSVLGATVEDVELTFEAGEVVACKARVGQETMDNFLAIDAGARRLGEVALVDNDSPISLSKRVFGSILYDENASCHLALGTGYPSCLAHGTQLTNDKALQGAGCNTSSVHTDFMIGSPEMDIEATLADSSKVQIFKRGQFVL